MYDVSSSPRSPRALGSNEAVHPSAARSIALHPPAAALLDGAFPVEHRTIRDGDAGTRDTVNLMADLIRDGALDPVVRGQAIRIIANTAERDYAAQMRALRAWVSEHVVFLRDPSNAELLHTPRLMITSILQNASGVIHVDCDDVAILGGALGMSIGLLCRVVTVAFRNPDASAANAPTSITDWVGQLLGGFDEREPFAHTWAELSSPIGSPLWVDVDTTRSAQGVDPSLIARSFIVDV